MTALREWADFYVIVGSSAGALIGLQFVVVTLIADIPVLRGQQQAGEAFGTPTIVHLGVALLMSAILDIPWNGIGAAAMVWGLVGFCGIVYEIIVVQRMRVQTLYKPVSEDWVFHVVLPIAAYVGLVVSAYAARTHLRAALFGVAAAVLLLLFVGIHNAWDAVTYHVFVSKQRQAQSDRPH
jgi:hypothetical protein